jgi:hypothetical protein
MSTEILIGVIGLITEGEYSGWQIFIQDGSGNTGGYLIFISRNQGSSELEGFDDWVASEAEIISYFEESKWVVDWGGQHK